VQEWAAGDDTAVLGTRIDALRARIDEFAAASTVRVTWSSGRDAGGSMTAFALSLDPPVKRLVGVGRDARMPF